MHETNLGMLIEPNELTNLTIVSPVKMEYGWNFSISGLKMKSGLKEIFLKFLHEIPLTMKSGLEEIFLKFLHALAIFY